MPYGIARNEEEAMNEGHTCGNCGSRPCGNFRDADHGACEKWTDQEMVPKWSADNEIRELKERVAMLEEFAWDALCQGAIMEGDELDNMCMSTWEMLSAHFEERGWLTTENGRIYKIVPVDERPK